MISTKKVLVNFSIGAAFLISPVLSEDLSTGYYLTGSIGGSHIMDLDYENSTSHITFDSGTGFDVGIGYDFGRTRLEASWLRAQSSGGVDAGQAFTTDATLDSYLLTGYYDFGASNKLNPFIGLSVGSTSLDHDNADDSGFSYGLALGLGIKTSDKTEVFLKSNGIITPELETTNWDVTSGSFVNYTLGFSYQF